MTRRRGANIKKSARRDVVARDDSTCQYCLTRLKDEEITIDHRIPKGKGGSNEKWNLVVSCADCNHLKDDEEWPIGFMVDPAAAFKAMWLAKA